MTGKRGEARLGFRLTAAGEPVGQGAKTLILSGLRAYESEALQGLVERYAVWRFGPKPQVSAATDSQQDPAEAGSEKASVR